MRTIAHISDLHFGREHPQVAAGLLSDLNTQKPSLLVVSGDLTQRARPQEFRAARAFFDQLPFPRVVVPGNHDIPLHNLVARFFRALHGFKEHISPDVDNLHEDAELAVFSLNSARSAVFKSGHISDTQVAWLKKGLAAAPKHKFRILVVHHPVPSVRGAGAALAVLEEGGVDLVLTGHMHESSVGDLAADLAVVKRSILIVGAGTAISARLRGEPNSYNILELGEDQITVKLRVWDTDAFRQADEFRFTRAPDRWVRAAR